MKHSFNKSIFALLAICALLLSACGTSKENNTGSNKGTDGKKVLNVGTEATFAPFEFIDKGEIVGFDVDLLNAVAEEAGYEVKIENTGWDSMLVGLNKNQLDIGMAGITIDDERKKSYDFSVPYFESISMIVFNKDIDIKSADDLKGKNIAVQNGTTGQFSAEAIVGKNSKNISKYKTAALMFQALQSGNADAAVTDIAVALEYKDKNPNSDINTFVDYEKFESEYYGIAFPKGSELKPEFDKALQTLFDNGKYAEVYKKWFNEEPNIQTLQEAGK